MRPFSLLIKPASGDCNLACRYCFYRCKRDLFPDTPRHRMSPAVLERLVASFMATPQATHAFGWQGGEPTLMGLEFFQQVVRLQQQHGTRGTCVSNGLQTNATLIDDAFAAFLAEYQFLVGCSLDGPADLHDRYRLTLGDRGSHADVLRGIDCLHRHRAEVNILVLVSQANVASAATVYRYLVDQGFLYHQYIPCVEYTPDGALQPYAISGPEWGRFLCDLFDAWHPADVRRVSIRHHDAILAKTVDRQPIVCTMSRRCDAYLVVEHNGNVYPCDFFVQPDLQLGNIMTDDWAALLDAPRFQQFAARKTDWTPACAACAHLDWCAGDCMKHRQPFSQSPMPRSTLCAGWLQFYDHAGPRFHALANGIRTQRRTAAALVGESLPTAIPRSPIPASRNAPCPCGSGRKFKHCCANRQN